MVRTIALLVALIPSAALSQQAGTETPPPLQGLFIDWRSLNRDAVRAESVERVPSETDRGAARTLGERVGEVVATGDCEGGERMAREAGDFELVAAVRRYCTQTQSLTGPR